MSIITIGIDPGRDGAVVILEDGRDVLAATRTKALCPKQYAPRAMADYIKTNGAGASLVAIERQHAMPGNGGTSMLTTGYGWGLWVGIAAALGVPYEVPAAKTWQLSLLDHGAGRAGKERSIEAAMRLLPGLDMTPGLVRRPHDGLADAGLMALWAHRRATGASR
jgi:hypothetical protein